MKNHNFPIGTGKYWKNPNESEVALMEYLDSASFDDLSITVTLIGERKTDGWLHDWWLINFERYRKESVMFEYRTGTGYRGKDKFGQPYATMPHIAGIMQSLLLDSQADEMSFNSWCFEYGYNNDSVKAFKIYQACCETAEKLRKVFNGQQIVEMRDILQDY